MGFCRIVIDADICIKIGSIRQKNFLELLLPLLANEIYMHRAVYDELLTPPSVLQQIDGMICSGRIFILDDGDLSDLELKLFHQTRQRLEQVMADPRFPRKNRGEIHALALAKVKAISVFVTDESDLQPIVDQQLNTQMHHIRCYRIIDIIKEIQSGQLIGLDRKHAKKLWVLSGKNKYDFDHTIWPLQ